MNGKDRVRVAVNHQNPDRVPYFIDFTFPVHDRLAAYYKEDVNRAVGNDIFAIIVNSIGGLRPENYDGSDWKDDFSVIWTNLWDNRGQILDSPLKRPSLEGYDFPDPADKNRFNRIPSLIDKNSDLFIIAVYGDFFERANFMRGFQNLLLDIYRHSEFVEELLDRLLEYNIWTIDHLMDNYSIDGLILSDDYGTQKDLMIPPQTWKKLIKPRLKEMFDRIHHKGAITLLHSCGNITKIIPDLIEIGLDVLHPVQPEAIDVFSVKRNFGDQLTLFGGICTQRILPYGTVDDVKAEVQKKVKFLGDGGGYIAAPGLTIQKDVPFENVLTLIKVLQEQ